MGKESSRMRLDSQKGQEYMRRISICGCLSFAFGNRNKSSPEEEVSVSMATAEEQPRLSE